MDKEAYEKILAAENTLWFYVSRRMVLKELLLNYVLLPVERHLDIGCGSGGIIKYLSGYSKCRVGIDISIKALTNAQKIGLDSLCVGDASLLCFPDNTFNLITTLDVLEHCQDDLQTLKEIRRVLKPGGYCILFVPALNILWSNLDYFTRHFRRYTEIDLRKKSQKASFNVIKLSYFNTFLFPVIFAGRMIQRFIQTPKGTPSKYDFAMPNKLVNSLLSFIFSSERYWLRVADFPIGSSILAILHKPKDDRE